MIIVYALDEGPSSDQRAFFLRLGPRLDALCAKAFTFLRTAGAVDFDPACLRLYAIEIPEDDHILKDSFGLEFADADANTIYGVTFEEGNPRTTYEDD